MKTKILKAAACAGLCCCTALTAVGCTNNTLDPETRPLQLATAALDGNFNPFTYTSQTDGDIISMTQIAMFTNDSTGDLICGENEATAALNYATTMYTAKEGGSVTATGSADGRTEYEVVIKNGIKFSDGVDLTVKDILFNLYVYLDVSYTGSSTVYSTDIQGLRAYRAQDPSYTDETTTDISSTFTNKALERVVNILNWLDTSSANETVPTDAQVKADIETTKKLFLEEITSDWNALETTWSSTYGELYNFTDAWQAYLFNENIAWVQTRLNADTLSAERIKDEDGKFVTSLEPTVAGANNVNAAVGEIHLQTIIDEITAATTSDKVSAYASQNSCPTEYALLQLQKEYCINLVYENYTEKSEIGNVLQYWATASTALDEFAAQERTKYYQNLKNQGIKVDNISGISTYSATGAELKNARSWKMTGETFNDNETYDVLKVVINGIDPKAIFNLAFPIAPLHYYSGTWGGKNYVEAAMNDTENKEFGVEVGNSTFFAEVLNDTTKNGIPVGAGPYMASSRDGGAAKERSEFFNSNIVYFERNNYFETLGSGIENAKIRLLRYQVTPDDKIMTQLVAGNIDFGMPSAKYENQNTATSTSHLGVETYWAGGYGYVGINPKFVPEVQVRQAIMKAMNTRSIIQNYYAGGLAENVWRPMSKTSWAYPDGATEWAATAYTTDNDEIAALVESAGYKKGSDGIYAKNGKKLQITFTIAGDSSDHPAYSMFTDAASILNEIGFDVSVSTSSTALRDMTRGNLAVWAAAWTSAIDPDMYQVYHMDSKATSVNNWNYPEILNPANTQFSYELNIVKQLSAKIDEGRSYLERDERTPVYAECLDLIMQLAVELPTYQRNELCVYNKNVLDRNTMTKSPSAYDGLISEIWKLDYVK